jgi:hypothetical protein
MGETTRAGMLPARVPFSGQQRLFRCFVNLPLCCIGGLFGPVTGVFRHGVVSWLLN